MSNYLHTSSRKYRRYSMLLLAVWLFALFAHSSHFEVTSQLDNNVECHLCHNNLDKVDDVKITATFSQRIIGRQTLIAPRFPLALLEFFTPQLRAPPLVNSL